MKPNDKSLYFLFLFQIIFHVIYATSRTRQQRLSERTGGHDIQVHGQRPASQEYRSEWGKQSPMNGSDAPLQAAWKRGRSGFLVGTTLSGHVLVGVTIMATTPVLRSVGVLGRRGRWGWGGMVGEWGGGILAYGLCSHVVLENHSRLSLLLLPTWKDNKV